MDTVHMKPVKLSEILPTLRALDKEFELENKDTANFVERGVLVSLPVSGHPGARVLVLS